MGKFVHVTPFSVEVEERRVYIQKSIQIDIRWMLYGFEDIQKAKILRYQVIPMRKACDLGLEIVIEKIHKRVASSSVLVSFDVNFIGPAYVPGTGNPEIIGPKNFETLAKNYKPIKLFYSKERR